MAELQARIEIDCKNIPFTTDISIMKLDANAKIPERGSPLSAGCDLCALTGGEEIILRPGKTCMIHTGLAVALPKWCFGAIFARSGLAAKQGLRPANCVGVIDSDYRGEIMVALHNDSMERRKVRDGDRIAQLVIIPFAYPTFVLTDALDNTERGNGGFGSTGVAYQ